MSAALVACVHVHVCFMFMHTVIVDQYAYIYTIVCVHSYIML